MYKFFEDRNKKTAAFDRSIFKKELKDSLKPLPAEAESFLKELTGKGYEEVVKDLEARFNDKVTGKAAPNLRSKIFDEWLVDTVRKHFKSDADSDAKALFMEDGFLTKLDAKEYNEAVKNSNFLKLTSDIVDHLNADLDLRYTSSVANMKNIVEKLREDIIKEEGDLEDQDYWKHKVEIDKNLLSKFDFPADLAKKPIKSEKNLLPHIASFLGYNIHFGTKVIPEKGKSTDTYSIVEVKDKNKQNKNEMSKNKKTIEEVLQYLADQNEDTASFLKAQIGKYGEGKGIEGYVDRILDIFSRPTKAGKFDPRFSYFFGVSPDTNFAAMSYEDFLKSIAFIKKKFVNKKGEIEELTQEKIEKNFPGLKVPDVIANKALHYKEKGDQSQAEMIMDEIKELPLAEGVKILSSYFKHVKDAKESAGEVIQNRFRQYLEGDLVSNAEKHLSLESKSETQAINSDPISVMPGKIKKVILTLKNVLAPFKEYDENDPTLSKPVQRAGESEEDFKKRVKTTEMNLRNRGADVRNALENLRTLVKESIPPQAELDAKINELKSVYKKLKFSDDKKQDKMLKDSVIDLSGLGSTINSRLSSEEGYNSAISSIDSKVEELTSGTSSNSLSILNKDLEFLEDDYNQFANIINAVNNSGENKEAFLKNIGDIKSTLTTRSEELRKDLSKAEEDITKIKSKYPEMSGFIADPKDSKEDRAKINKAIKAKLTAIKEEAAVPKEKLDELRKEAKKNDDMDPKSELNLEISRIKKEYGDILSKSTDFTDKISEINSYISIRDKINDKINSMGKSLKALPTSAEDKSGLKAYVDQALSSYALETKDLNTSDEKLNHIISKKETSIYNKKVAISDTKKEIKKLEEAKKALIGQWDLVKDVVSGGDFRMFTKMVEDFRKFLSPYSDKLLESASRSSAVTGWEPTRGNTMTQSEYSKKKEKEEAEAKKAKTAAEGSKVNLDPKYDFNSINSLYSKANDLYNTFNNLAKHISSARTLKGGGRFFEYVQQVTPASESKGTSSTDDKAVDPKEYVAYIDDIITNLELFDSKKLITILNNKALKIDDPSVDLNELKETIEDYVKKIDKLRKDIRKLLPEQMFAKIGKYIASLESLDFLKKKVKLASTYSDFDMAYNLRVAALRILEAATTDKGADWMLFGERYINVDGQGQKVTVPNMFEFTDQASQFVDSLLSHGFDFFKDPKNFQDSDGNFSQEKFNDALKNKIQKTVAKVVLKGSDNFEKYLKKNLKDTYLKSNEKLITDFTRKKKDIEKMQNEVVEIKDKYLGKLESFAQFLRNPRKAIKSELSPTELERFEGESGESVSKDDLDEFKSAVLDKDIAKIKSMLSPKHLEMIEDKMPGIWDGLVSAQFSSIDKPQKDPLSASILRRLVDLFQSGESKSKENVQEFKKAIKSKDVEAIKKLLPAEALKDPYMDDILEFVAKEPSRSGLTEEVFGDVDPFDYLVDLFKEDKGAISSNRKRLQSIKKQMGEAKRDRRQLIDRDYFKKNVGKLLESISPHRSDGKVPEGPKPTTRAVIRDYYKDFEEFSKKLEGLNKTLSTISDARNNNDKELRQISSLLRDYEKSLGLKEFQIKNIGEIFLGLKDLFSKGALSKLRIDILGIKDQESGSYKGGVLPKVIKEEREYLLAHLEKAFKKLDDKGNLGDLKDILTKEKSEIFKNDADYKTMIDQIETTENTLKKFKSVDKLGDLFSKEKGVLSVTRDKKTNELDSSSESVKALLKEVKENLGEDSGAEALINGLLTVHNSIVDTAKKIESLEDKTYELTLRDLGGEKTYELKGISELKDFTGTFKKYETDLKKEKATQEQKVIELNKKHKVHEVTREPINKDDEETAIETEDPKKTKEIVTEKTEIDVPMSFADKFKSRMKLAFSDFQDITASDLSFLDKFRKKIDSLEDLAKTAGTGEPEEKQPKEIPSDKKLHTPLYNIEDRETLEFILNKKIKDIKKIDDVVKELESSSGIDKVNANFLKEIANMKRRGSKEINAILKKEYSVAGEKIKLDEIPYRFRELLDNFQEQTNKRILKINGLKKDIIKHKYGINEMKNYIDFDTNEVKDVSEDVIAFYKKIFFKDLLIALNSYWNTNAGRFNLFGEKEMPAYNEIYDTVNNLVGTKVKPVVWKNLAQIDQQLRMPLDRDMIRSKGVSDDVIVVTDKKSRLAEVYEYIRQYEKMVDLENPEKDTKEIAKIQADIKEIRDMEKEKKKILSEGIDKVTEKEAKRLQEIQDKLSKTSIESLENKKKQELLKYYYGNKSKGSTASTLEYLYSEVDRLEGLKNFRNQLYAELRELADEKVMEDTLKTIRKEIEDERTEVANQKKLKEETLGLIKERETSVDKKAKAVEDTSKKIEERLDLKDIKPIGDIEIETEEEEDPKTPKKEEKEEDFSKTFLNKADKSFLKSLISESKKTKKEYKNYFESDLEETKEKAYEMLEDVWKEELSVKPDILKRIKTDLPKIIRDLDKFEGFLDLSPKKVKRAYEDSPHYNSKHLYSKAIQNKIASMLDI